MKNCTKCGEINTTDTRFCVRCGNDTFISDDEKICTRCGMTNAAESAFCIGCGEVLAKDVRVLEAAAAKPLPMPPKESESVCAVCGAPIEVNDVYCTNCGSLAESSVRNNVVKKRLCPKCGRPNDLAGQSCSYCFNELEGGDVEEYALDFIDTAQSGGQSIRQAVLVSLSGKKSRICPNCGMVNEFEQPYCVKCGAKLQVEFSKKYCLVCGAENNHDAKFCTKCKYAFAGRAPGQMGWKCATCGELNDNDSGFCIGCGAKRPRR